MGRRLFPALLCLLIGLGSGIGNLYAQDATQEVIAPQACVTPGNLTMWVWDQHWADIIGTSIDQWEKDYCPGATVDISVHPWEEYWNTLDTNAASGDLPDLFNMSQDRFYFYANKNALLDLQPYFDADHVNTSAWASGMVDPYRMGDDFHLYAGPVNWDTVVIFYNKDMLDAAGLAYPTAAWTWDDFAVYAQKLTNASTGVYGAAVYSGYQAGYANWIASTGIPPVVGAARRQCTLRERRSLEALNYLKGLFDAGYMPDVSTIGGSSADDAFNFWVDGKAAMISGGSWKLPDALTRAKFHWDVVQLPRYPATGESRSIVHSVGYVASARTMQPDLAANLIQFLVSDEGQRYFAQAGGVAPANPSQQQAWIDSFGDTDVNIHAFVDALDDSQGVTVFTQIWDTINSYLVVNIFDLSMSVDDATKLVCNYVNANLPRQN
ncbi:MAG: sugar ABC transporter substrate-binding protein [Chloroflexota bacterium]